uniref:WAP four-disulfide core domain protein 8-like isoform X3 n=1 Tax=Ictidomys tridecemlineatus TaxID=43179 RepID=UPI001A9DE820|nr:WAP four-disulfide core domain protein 8-like isoform X3 [Ictidomys tridecemlineatus]
MTPIVTFVSPHLSLACPCVQRGSTSAQLGPCQAPPTSLQSLLPPAGPLNAPQTLRPPSVTCVTTGHLPATSHLPTTNTMRCLISLALGLLALKAVLAQDPTFISPEAAPKAGSCPWVDNQISQLCQEEDHCSHDSECDGDKKCCMSDCARKCLDPVQDPYPFSTVESPLQ